MAQNRTIDTPPVPGKLTSSHYLIPALPLKRLSMTLEDWLDCTDHGSLTLEFSAYSHRKLHLLIAALLRRVWDRLPSEHERRAVEATEAFAEGHTTADALAWVRTQAARETGNTLWLARGPRRGDYDYDLIDPCPCCAHCDSRLAQHECQVAKRGGIIGGVRDGVDDPATIATETAFEVLWLENPDPSTRRPDSAGWLWAWQSLFATVREVIGETGTPDRLAPEWLTSDVVALARGIYADQNFDLLPILADALQDAGCDDEAVLWHCRRPGGHARGCWVVDLVLGFE